MLVQEFYTQYYRSHDTTLINVYIDYVTADINHITYWMRYVYTRSLYKLTTSVN